jgi:hypothetical protein
VDKFWGAGAGPATLCLLSRYLEKMILETDNMEERVAIMTRVLEIMVVLQVSCSCFFAEAKFHTTLEF